MNGIKNEGRTQNTKLSTKLLSIFSIDCRSELEKRTKSFGKLAVFLDNFRIFNHYFLLIFGQQSIINQIKNKWTNPITKLL